MSTATAITPDDLQSNPTATGTYVVSDREFVKQLRDETCAVRVHIKRFGIRKALSSDQVGQAADVFEAEQDVLRATKKLIDTKGKEWNDVARVLYQAKIFWRSSSTPYPEPGWRLMRRSKIMDFRAQMVKFVAELDQACEALAEKYAELKEQSRVKLGDLYDDSDYPARIDNTFSLEWDFPSVEPPEYLKELNPELYEQQLKLVESRFEESLAMAEQMLAEELQKLVSHLVEKLQPAEDGKKKQIRSSSVDNLKEFFGRFSELKITSNGQLNAIVEQAQKVVAGVDVESLKGDGAKRQSIAESMNAIKGALDSMIVNAPIRAINLDD